MSQVGSKACPLPLPGSTPPTLSAGLGGGEPPPLPRSAPTLLQKLLPTNIAPRPPRGLALGGVARWCRPQVGDLGFQDLPQKGLLIYLGP